MGDHVKEQESVAEPKSLPGNESIVLVESSSRESSATSIGRLLHPSLEAKSSTLMGRRGNSQPSFVIQKRFRLPWLDGNSNSGHVPGAFNADVGASRRANGASKSQTDQTEAAVGSTMTGDKTASLRYGPTSGAAVRPFVSIPSLSDVAQKKPTKRRRSCSSPASPPGLSSKDSQTSVPGHWPTKGGQAQYTPSTYSSEPPSDSDIPSYLSRKEPVSYENLVVKPVESPQATSQAPRSAMWPMVPLSETDNPMRISSLSFREPLARKGSYLRNSRSAHELGRESSPSSMGRYTDGTISREPTVKASATQARLDRAAIAQQPRSPDVSPKSQAPTGPLPTATSAYSSGTFESASLQRAVTGLHDLMHEALSVASEAAQSNQSHEVAQILNEATIALRKANTVQGRMAEPLRLSDADLGAASSSDDYMSGSDSDAFVESETSSIASRREGSDQTVPTNYTKSRSALLVDPAGQAAVNDAMHPGDRVLNVIESRKPTLNAPFLKDAERPKSQRGLFEAASPADSYLSSSSGANSIVKTPQTMYHQPSADSAVTDWAYIKRVPGSRELREPSTRPKSRARSSEGLLAVVAPAPIRAPTQGQMNFLSRNIPLDTHEVETEARPQRISLPTAPRRRTIHQPVSPIQPLSSNIPSAQDPLVQHPWQHISHEEPRYRHAPHLDVGHLFESTYYRLPDKDRDGLTEPQANRYGVSTAVASRNMSLRHPRRKHISLPENETFRLHKYRRQPVAREWSTTRKRVTATIACLNTALVGLTAGIYAGEVPRIQYQLADVHHRVILGNVLLYIGMGLATMFAWPLPLLHGRKPYTLAALAIALPLNFPQAVVVDSYRSPQTQYFVGLLLPRAFMGLALGFANVNFLSTLLDIFGASLQSANPHQEFVVMDDIRRQGGGMGLWLGIWAWCFVGSLSTGFLIGAGITASLNPAWGFYIVVIIIAVFLFMNVIAPETRRAPYRRSVLKYLDENEKVRRRVARGEVKLHISQDGPKYWWEEVLAGLQLMGSMMLQPGFFVLTFYLAWIYALVVLVTLLLGALLSRDYHWRPQYIGLAVFALAIGALLAVPLTKANLFSRDRMQPPRTDSMTFQPRVTWTSHLLRRCIFTFALPIAAVAYVLTSKGPSISWAAPTIMSALVGFLSCLAVSECIGLIMETFDTSDLQPGVNTKHRLQSMESATRRRRTNYSSFPRVAAGIFTAQALGFFLAAGATGASGRITRSLGAQAATGVVAGILLIFTLLLALILWRFRSIQVIPNHALGTARSSRDWQAQEAEHDPYFKPVIIGNPSGKMRRMNLLETGSWSRWTEIRKLNKLIKHKK